MTSKERAKLRGLANRVPSLYQVGKDGISENMIKQIDDALNARELIKGNVLENSMLTAREACDILAEACNAEQVQVIGSKFTLFKRNPQNPKIELVKASKKK